MVYSGISFSHLSESVQKRGILHAVGIVKIVDDW